jgi:site-specific recombinase XerD
MSKIEELSSGFIRNFLDELSEDHSTASIQIFALSIRSFLTWLMENYSFTPYFSIRQIRTHEIENLIRTGVSWMDLNIILKGCGKDIHVSQDRAILVLLLATGISPSELCKLKVVDLDIDLSVLNVSENINHKSRSIPLSEGALREVMINIHKRKGVALTAKLFVSIDGKELTPAIISKVIAERSSIPKAKNNLNTRDLRNSFAISKIKEHVNPDQVTYLLGVVSYKSSKFYKGVSKSALNHFYCFAQGN